MAISLTNVFVRQKNQALISKTGQTHRGTAVAGEESEWERESREIKGMYNGMLQRCPLITLARFGWSNLGLDDYF
jgi:hypothetical protein